jgi:hypothetical protein
MGMNESLIELVRQQVSDAHAAHSSLSDREARLLYLLIASLALGLVICLFAVLVWCNCAGYGDQLAAWYKSRRKSQRNLTTHSQSSKAEHRKLLSLSSSAASSSSLQQPLTSVHVYSPVPTSIVAQQVSSTVRANPPGFGYPSHNHTTSPWQTTRGSN